MSKLSDAAKVLGDEYRKLTIRGKEIYLKKMSVEEVVKKYPRGVHVTWMDALEGQQGREYLAFTFAEDKGSFVSTGGKGFRDLWELWLEKCGGCMADVQEALAEHPELILITPVRSQYSKPYLKVQNIADN